MNDLSMTELFVKNLSHPELWEAQAALAAFAQIARQLGHERLQREAEDASARVAAGLFYVACVGQFKRGKSTLPDALVGARLLPIGVVPVTTVPTVIRYGAAGEARVRLGGGAWESIPAAAIADYVSQEFNPDNIRGVAGVEVFTPSPLLAGGMCLVDTPGLGSVFAGNTDATRAFVPHIDAALIVFGADPPLTGAELDLAAEIAAQVPDLIFVLNKADRIPDADRAAAVAFAQAVLQRRLQREVGPIYQVSALEQTQTQTPSRDWTALVEALHRLAQRSGRQLSSAGAARGALRLRRELAAVVAEEKAALLRPLEQSEARLAALDQTIAAAERSLADIGHLFAAEQHRLAVHFAARRQAFLRRERPNAAARFRLELDRLPRGGGPAFRRLALAAAQEHARALILPWLLAEQQEAAAAFGQVSQRFIGIANDFLCRTAATGGLELGLISDFAPLDDGLSDPSQFRFYDFIATAQPASPIGHFADALRGAARAYNKIRADALAFLDLLLDTNAARVQNDLTRRVAESRGQLEAQILRLLREVVAVSTRAAQRAQAARAQGAAVIADRLDHLAGVERALQ